MKRKVTDLKPNEAILISNDSERDAILQLMEDAGMRWNSGHAIFDINIRTPYPYCFAYKFRSIDYVSTNGIRVVNKNSFYEAEITYPATDFIGSEFIGDGLTVSEPDNTISIEASETIATLRAEKAELIEALRATKTILKESYHPRTDIVKDIVYYTLAKYETK